MRRADDVFAVNGRRSRRSALNAESALASGSSNNGELPTIIKQRFICNFMSPANCTAGGSICPWFEECSHDACFAAWTNSSGEVKMLHQGCWNNEHVVGKACGARRCVATEIERESVHFCCCHLSQCNERVYYSPSAHSLLNTSHVITSSPSTVAPPSEHVFTGVLISMAPILLIAFLVFTLYYCYRRHRLNILSTHRGAPSLVTNGDVKRVEGNLTGGLSNSHNLSNFVDRGVDGSAFSGQPHPPCLMLNGHLVSNMNIGFLPPYVGGSGRSVCSAPTAGFRIQLGEVKAKGRFGVIRRGIMPAVDGDKEVAVKVFPPGDAESWITEQEIYNIAALRAHPNILHYYGSEVRGCSGSAEMFGGCFDLTQMSASSMSSISGGAKEFWIITAYHSHGSLYDYLKSHVVSLQELLGISVSMMRGLAFLHEEMYNSVSPKPTIVHRDFKSRNVLIKSDLSACIADFGLALKCENGISTADTHGQVGTRRYMSGEILEGATEFSAFAFRQIDVYAAGLVLWEILSRCKFFENEQVPEYKLPFEVEVGCQPSLQEMQDVVVAQGLRPKFREYWFEKSRDSYLAAGDRNAVLGLRESLARLRRTIVEMWDREPEARLTAGCAMERLVSLAQSINSLPPLPRAMVVPEEDVIGVIPTAQITAISGGGSCLTPISHLYSNSPMLPSDGRQGSEADSYNHNNPMFKNASQADPRCVGMQVSSTRTVPFVGGLDGPQLLNCRSQLQDEIAQHRVAFDSSHIADLSQDSPRELEHLPNDHIDYSRQNYVNASLSSTFSKVLFPDDFPRATSTESSLPILDIGDGALKEQHEPLINNCHVDNYCDDDADDDRAGKFDVSDNNLSEGLLPVNSGHSSEDPLLWEAGRLSELMLLKNLQHRDTAANRVVDGAREGVLNREIGNVASDRRSLTVSSATADSSSLSADSSFCELPPYSHFGPNSEKSSP